MDTKKTKQLYLSVAFLACCSLAGFTSSPAQTPTPSPSVSAGNTSGYEITSSVELGVRGLNVNGDHEKYRSDLNYRPGFRLVDSSILIEDKTGLVRPFDSALIQASGWGSDPSSAFRMNMDRDGAYKLDANIRRVRYFNNLKNTDVTWSQVFPNRSQHRYNTLHHFGDFDLTLFPERQDFRVRLGYSFNDTEGPGAYTIRYPQFSGPTLTLRGDEFEVNSIFKTKSDDFRAGLEGRLIGFNVGFIYGHREFRDDTRFFIDTFNPGNDLGATNATVTTFTRQYPTRGTTDFFNFFVQRTIAKKLDFTGRFIYSETKSEFSQADFAAGTSSQAGTAFPRIIIDFDQINVLGDVKRPQTRADAGVTYRITDSFRLSNTFAFDQFNIGGGNRFFEYLTSRTTAGAPRPDAVSDNGSWRATSYRRFSNTLEGHYEFGRRFGVGVGYRYSNRTVHLAALDRSLITGATSYAHEEEFENNTNSVFATASIKPNNSWSIYVDAERGQADNVFTRLANNDFFNFRVRSITRLNQFTLNLSFITKDNDNPGVSSPIGNIPATQTIADSKIRIFSGSLDWAPRPEFEFSGGYTYHLQDSAVDIIVPVGTPVLPSTQFLLGRSEYFLRDSFLFFDVTARPIKRVTFFASYRLSDDQGQGDRVVARAQDIISSYPMRFHMPEARLAIRMTRMIDLNLGYQYYSYREEALRIPFNATPVYPAQNYTAHMTYASVRFYFGRAAGDR